MKYRNPIDRLSKTDAGRRLESGLLPLPELKHGASNAEEFSGMPVDALGESSIETFDPFDLQLIDAKTNKERLQRAHGLYARLVLESGDIEIPAGERVTPEEIELVGSPMATDEGIVGELRPGDNFDFDLLIT